MPRTGDVLAAEVSDGGLQVQAAGNRNGDDFVIMRSEDGGKLADAFGVTSLGEADEKLAADAEDVAAF